MNMYSQPVTNLVSEMRKISESLSTNGQCAEAQDKYAQENLEALKALRVFSNMVPSEYGGGGATYAEIAAMLFELAQAHPSTALSCSMHQHIIAANVYNDSHGKPGRSLLEKVAVDELVLVSTGAGDWLASSGECIAVPNGFKFSATKHFASGSVIGDILVTSAPFNDPVDGPQVLHFPVPLKASGVTVLDNWNAMGMRATGSNSVKLEDVFVPEEAVGLRRPRGDYHGVWNVVLPVALPLIMSVYQGIAVKAANVAKERCRSSKDPSTPYILGEMENAITTAELAVASMINMVGDLDFTPDVLLANEIVKRKTIAALACKQAVAKAMEACGGFGYTRDGGIENLFRDVQASHFHPLQEKRQLLFSGSIALDLEPPREAFE